MVDRDSRCLGILFLASSSEFEDEKLFMTSCAKSVTKITSKKSRRILQEEDSEGLAGDGEMEYNEEMDEQGDWEDAEDEIAAG